jgi:two-component system sensor histidine kinase KdpD
MLLRGQRPSHVAGVVTTVVVVVICSLLIYPLKRVTTVSSLGVVYLLGVVIVSAYWGVWFGAATSMLSAAAFNFFHLPPVDEFSLDAGNNVISTPTSSTSTRPTTALLS